MGPRVRGDDRDMRKLIACLFLAWSGMLPGGNAVAAEALPTFDFLRPSQSTNANG